MDVVKQSKAWLRLFRAHTVILEAPMAFLGAVVGIGAVADPRVGLWLLFGIGYHLVGYGMNSYVDWKKGFDKDDDQKQHHPLNTGDIQPSQAKKVIYGSTAALFAYLFALTYTNLTAVGLSGLMVGSGLAYNYLGKYTELKAIPISIAHTLVFFIPYYLYASELSTWVLAMTAAYFIHHIYQIAISGDIKDIQQDEASLLKSLGVHVKPHKHMPDVGVFITSSKALILAYFLAILQLTLAIGGIVLNGFTVLDLTISIVFASAMIYYTDKMLQQGAFIRSKRVKYISSKELFGYTLIHSASTAVIGTVGFTLMLVSMLVYLGIVSKFIWGNWLVPEV